MSNICQYLFALGVEVCFSRMWGFYWRVSDWWCHLRKYLGTNESKTTLCIDVSFSVGR